MKKVILIISILISIASESYGLTKEEILVKVDEIRAPSKTFVFDLKLIVRKGEEESVCKFLVRVKDSTKSLVLYKSPPSIKGRVLLMVNDNMWIYFPGTNNPIRISPQQQIMGDVSNADVARVVYDLDYKAESMEEDILDGKKFLKMNLAAKTKAVAYKSINLWIEKDSFKPVKGEFFALSGRLLKTVYYERYKDILGKERPTILKVYDSINKSEISIMEYSNIKIEDTPDIYFQKTYMERVK